MLASRFSAAEDGEWAPVGAPALFAVGGCILLILYLTSRNDGWVPLLDSANLAFHEAGHPIFGLLLGDRITVYGGTLAQLLFPVAAAVTFLRRRETVSYALALVWLYENLLNVGRYMADARAHLLPLVGSGEHDWSEIFTRWGVLDHDLVIAGLIRMLAWSSMIATWGWLFWRCRLAR